MVKKLLMGNEAIAYGALESGVQVATAYPGTPSSEIFATLAGLAREKGFYAEWSVNEKAALEVAAGAAYAGARAIVSMKQVGLNVASDPLMSLAYIGVNGGLVLAVADDPGPHSSQTEQDTRLFARFAKLPVLDPATPQDAYEMAKAAFDLSEELKLPVIVRPTTRTCHVCQDVEVSDSYPPRPVSGFKKSPDWVIFPSLSARKHPWLNAQQEKARSIFSNSPFNELILNSDSRLGIIASGVSFNYVREAMESAGVKASVLKIGTPYPLPEVPVLELFKHADRVLVVEEQEPVVEEQVITLAWKHRLPVAISGKHDGLAPREGEFNVNIVKSILDRFYSPGREQSPAPAAPAETAPPLPLRTPVLCAGCPHRASFYIFKEAAKGTDAVFTGDIGCYTLGAIPPLLAMDTCLCMGAGVTIASGLNHAEPHRKQVAFLGDSTFFHSGITGLINVLYNRTGIVVVILDNSTTAMTGHQPHPGLPWTALGQNDRPIDITRLVQALGVELVREVDPCDTEASYAAAREALSYPGPAVVVMKRACAAMIKSASRCRVNPDLCTACGLCATELGCPALALTAEGAVIGQSCTGCSLCAYVCPAGAIEEVNRES